MRLYDHGFFGGAASELTNEIGVFPVERPKDAINLSTIGVAAVAFCTETVVEQQTDTVASLARELVGGAVSFNFDLDH